jgi:hypothetical protein
MNPFVIFAIFNELIMISCKYTLENKVNDKIFQKICKIIEKN